MLRFFLCILVALILLGCNKLFVSQNGYQNTIAAEANVKLAMAFLKQNDMKQAKQKLLLAQKLAPYNPAVWYTLGYFSEAVGETSDAKNNYKFAILLNPKNGASLNNYGAFLYRTGHYNESMKQFLLAINDPEYLDTASAYENAGRCALKLSNQNLARQYFQKALAHDPSMVISRDYLRRFLKTDYLTPG